MHSSFIRSLVRSLAFRRQPEAVARKGFASSVTKFATFFAAQLILSSTVSVTKFFDELGNFLNFLAIVFGKK